MRTVSQIRRDEQVGIPVNKNSLYKPIERLPRKFNPLKIPKSLQVFSSFFLCSKYAFHVAFHDNIGKAS